MRIQMLCEMSFGYKLLLQNFLQKCPKPYNLKLMSEIIMNFLQFFRENLVFFRTLLSICSACWLATYKNRTFVFHILPFLCRLTEFY